MYSYNYNMPNSNRNMYQYRGNRINNNDQRLIGGGFVAPLLLGGVAGYALGANRPNYYYPQPYPYYYPVNYNNYYYNPYYY